MSNIVVQKPSQLYGAEDPIQVIRELFNWSPLRHLGTALPAPEFMPAFEVRETRDRYIFKADMPGVKEADVEVNVTGNRLSVAGTRKIEQIEEAETLYTEERTFGAFTRSFVLPDGADLPHVQAALREGVLTIVIPKIPEMKPRKIALETSGKVKA